MINIIVSGQKKQKVQNHQIKKSKMIMNAENPSDKWLLYPINIIENSTFIK
jgi:hypothetical protein